MPTDLCLSNQMGGLAVCKYDESVSWACSEARVRVYERKLLLNVERDPCLVVVTSPDPDAFECSWLVGQLNHLTLHCSLARVARSNDVTEDFPIRILHRQGNNAYYCMFVFHH